MPLLKNITTDTRGGSSSRRSRSGYHATRAAGRLGAGQGLLTISCYPRGTKPGVARDEDYKGGGSGQPLAAPGAPPCQQLARQRDGDGHAVRRGPDGAGHLKPARRLIGNRRASSECGAAGTPQSPHEKRFGDHR